MLAAAILSVLLLPHPDARLAAAIERMGAEDWATRENATTAAAAYGRRGYAQLATAARWHPDAEVRARCRAITYAEIDRAVARFGKLPWLTAYSYRPYFCNDIEPIYRPYLAAVFPDGDYASFSPDGWPEYRYATTLYIRDRLHAILFFGGDTDALECEIEHLRQAEPGRGER